MNLSIVTGSVYRLSGLQALVTSIRATVPVGVTYEIIVVGVQADDLTADWCRAQQDVRFIAQAGLFGAIRAFDEGARAATGEYVILANDDIIFAKGAIPRAIVHLERTPTCGAVAFADDRPGPSKWNDALGFGVQLMRSANSAPVVYACVGMFRRWLGDLAGWWGSGDPVMRDGHTYGGDTYLSARLWELGYTVDWIAECRVKDMIHEDALRERNRQAEAANPGVFYRRYPNGPTVADHPLVGPLDAERLRTLYLPVYEPGAYYATQKQQKRGLREAFAKYGPVWEIDYCNQPFDLVQAVRTWQPDLLFLQLHSAEQVNADLIAAARAAKPDMAVTNWCGDVWSRHLLEPGMIEALKHVDVQLTVNTAVFPKYELHGIEARYWQCAAEPVDETRLPTHLQSGVPIQAHDVLILANAYSAERKRWGRDMWNALSKDYNVGFYGAGWTFERGTTTYDFAASYALTKQAKITCGDNQFPTETGFVSNRVFECLNAGGAMLIHQHIPGAQELIGLTPGEHFIEATDTADMIEKVRYWLHPDRDEERQAIAARAREWSRETQSFDSRVEELLFNILPEVLGEG